MRGRGEQQQGESRHGEIERQAADTGAERSRQGRGQEAGGGGDRSIAIYDHIKLGYRIVFSIL